MEKYGLLLGRLCYGRILHCTSRFSSAGLLIISLIYRRFWFPLAGLAAYVGFSSVSPWGGCEEACGVTYHSHMDRTFGIHTSLCDVLVSYKHDIAYDVSQYPSGFADLCFLIWGMKPVHVILSSTNSSACCLEAYSVHHLFLVFFRCLSHQNQLQGMRSALDLEGHSFHVVVSFCFLLSPW